MYPINWQEKKLGELVTFQRGFDLPKSDFKPGKYPVMGSNGLIGKHNEYKARGPGITIGRSGNLGEPYYIENDYWPHNTTLFSLRFYNSCPKFIYYLLKKIRLHNFNAGSAVPTLNRNHIHPIKIFVPQKFTEQKRISEILSILDKKIELNNKINCSLEQISKLLFKHWFIDFEFPNEQGQPYKSLGGELIDSELGKIPKGWNILNFANASELLMGVSPKGNTYNNIKVGLPLINGAADFKDNIISPNKYSSEPIRVSKIGDIIFCIRATIGNITFSDKEYCLGRGVAAIQPHKVIYKYLLYFYLLNSLNKITKQASGSVIMGLSKDDISNLKFVAPSEKKLSKFHFLIENIFKSIENNKDQNNVLIQIRDSILPKLITGKIRVNLEDMKES